MLRGLYTAESGMLAQWHQMNVVSNNLANLNTTSYKRESAILKSFPEMLMRRLNDTGIVKVPAGAYDLAPIIGKMGTGVELNEVHTHFQQGSLKSTENDFDLALIGKGFFVVNTDRGERFTRNGTFTMDQDGYWVTQEGFRLQGEKGDIRIKSANFQVLEDGGILENQEFSAEDLGRFVDKTQNNWLEPVLKDRIRIVRFYNERMLKKEGASFYTATKHSGEARDMQVGEGRAKVLHGYLETSNVNPVLEMTRMIEVHRAYEANQRVLLTNDSLLQKSVNEIART